MSVKSFTIGGTQYNAAMASAVDQDRLMSLLSGALLSRWITAAQNDVPVGDHLLTCMFMNMGQEIKQQCADILMRQVLLNGTQQRITAADFGGKMVQYNQLLTELLKWNLDDFFVWLPAAVEEAKRATPHAAQ